MVGDSAQAIYQWRGAKDVMTGFDGTHLTLSQSFRFGPDLAAGQPLAAPRRRPDPPHRHPRRAHRTRPRHPVGRRAVPHQRRRHGPGHAPHGGRLPGCPGRGRRQPAGPGPRRPRPEGGPPHPPPRTHPLSLLGPICRTTPPTTRPDATCSPWSTSSRPTALMPSSRPSPTLPPSRTPRSPSPPPTRRKDVNGPACSSRTTSPVPRTTRPTSRQTPADIRSHRRRRSPPGLCSGHPHPPTPRPGRTVLDPRPSRRPPVGDDRARPPALPQPPAAART